ncbi:hypothetical protein K438DRAFT_1781350 [Mycena galopus ATCC 62051]|nr:hypothetical protein K438DRAFT_1781350 [Mycena galopus ATCC 62051]
MQEGGTLGEENLVDGCFVVESGFSVDARAGGVDGGDENLGIRPGSSAREQESETLVATLAEYTAICETSAVISELSETRDSKGGYSHNGVGLCSGSPGFDWLH